MIIIIIDFKLLESIRWIHQLKKVRNVVEYFKWKQNGMYNLYLSKKKKESENSRQYMLYIYEIIFPKDVRELPVNEIYIKKMIHGICMINSVCLFCHVKFLLHLILSVNAMQQHLKKKKFAMKI